MAANRLAALLILTCSLTGCSGMPGFWAIEGNDSSPQPSSSEQVRQVLAYSRHLDELRTSSNGSRDALDREYRSIQALVSGGQPSIVEQIKLAWLTALPGSRFQDTAQALRDLQRVREQLAPSTGPLRDLVSWMSEIIRYRRSLYRKLRAQRVLRAAEATRREALEEEVASLQRLNADLSEKIGVLADVDHRIDERTLLP